MGQIHYQVVKVPLLELARATEVVHVRRLEQTTPRLDRFEVIEVLRSTAGEPLRAGEIIEVVREDAWVQETLSDNPYSHPIQVVHQVEPFVPVPEDASEWITFVMRQAPGLYQYHPPVRLPLTSRAELLASMPVPSPPQRTFPHTVEIAGAVAALGPFVMQSSCSSSITIDGVTTASSLNLAALVGGAVAIVCALVALTFVAKTEPSKRTVRVLAAVATLGLGVVQVLRGLYIIGAATLAST